MPKGPKKKYVRKYEDTGRQCQLLDVMIVNNELMCAHVCDGNSDCTAFRMGEDETGITCELFKEGSGNLVQQFFEEV